MGDLQILRPFGPSIVKLSIPDYLVKKLNEQRSVNIKHEIVKNSDHFFSGNELTIIQKVNNYINKN